jgi:TolB-like protein/tetratricopeptide (TPR) repeat protein
VREVAPSAAANAEFGTHLSKANASSFGECTIAVLPFTNDNPRFRRQVDDIVERLTLDLTRVCWLSVVAQNLSLSHRGRSTDARHAGRALGARYVLQGTAAFVADHRWISVQLVNAESGQQIWAERYGGHAGGDLESLCHGLAAKVVTAVKIHIGTCDSIRAWRKQAADLSAWDCVLRAISLINTRRKSDWGTARDLVTEAVKKDPGYVQAYALLSYVTTLGVAAGWQHRKHALAAAFDAAHRALSLNACDPWAQLAMGFALAWNGQPDEAVLRYRQSLALDPSLAHGHTLLGASLTYLGLGREALRETQLARDSFDADLFSRGNAGVNNNTMAIACFVAGQHREGVGFGQRALAESPNLPTIHRILVANHALSGGRQEAKQSLRKLQQLVPRTSIRSIAEWLPFNRMDERQRMLGAFRQLGLR